MVLNLHCRTCGRRTDIAVTDSGYMDDDLCGWCRAREADLATDAEYEKWRAAYADCRSLNAGKDD